MFDMSIRKETILAESFILVCYLHTCMGVASPSPLTEYLMPNDIFDKEADFIQLYLQGKINMRSIIGQVTTLYDIYEQYCALLCICYRISYTLCMVWYETNI